MVERVVLITPKSEIVNNMPHIRPFSLWFFVSVVLVMAGCATTPDTTPLPTPDISSSAQIDDSVRRPTPVFEYPNADAEGDSKEMQPLSRPPTYSNENTSTSRTVVALLDQASRMEASGNPEKAAATLERALRIEPRNARLWHRLAVIRYQQGQYTQAESLAAKSSTLAQNDRELKQKNAELIESIRQHKPYIR